MAKRPNSGKLTAKPANSAQQTAAAALDDAGIIEFPDAVAYIKALGNEREGIEWNLRVYKLDGSGRGVKIGQQFLFEVEPEELPGLETNLAESYPAGGLFKVVVRADNQIVRSAQLNIAPRPGYRPPPPAYLQPVAPAPAAEAQDRTESFFTRMTQVLEHSAQQTRELIAAIANRPTPAAPTLKEQVEMLSMIQNLMPKGAQENTMEMFEKGMTFASKIYDARGDSGGGASWMDIIKEAIAAPEFRQALGAIAAGAQHAHAAQLAAPQPVALLSPQNPVAAQVMDTLLRQAVAGVDPKFVAQKLFDQLPPEVVQELEAQGDNANVVGYIIHQFPQAQIHRAWLSALVSSMWDDEAPPPSPTMNDANARPDGPQQSQT